MAEIDIVYRQVVPDIPRSVESEQTNIYIPIAGDENAGISKFNPSDFVLSSGLVKLKYSQSDLVKNSDPLTKPSYVKLDSSEFEYSSPANPDYPLASVNLKREFSANDVFSKRSLIKIDSNDFVNDVENDNTIKVMWPTNPFNEVSKYGYKLNSDYFDLSQDKVLSLKIPKAYEQSKVDDGFGTMKIDTSSVTEGHYLQYDSNGYLTFNEPKLESKILSFTDWTYIKPNYANTVAASSYLQQDPDNEYAKIAIRKNYFKNTVVIDDVTYDADSEIPEEVLEYVNPNNIYVRTEFLLNKDTIGLSNVEDVSITGTVNVHNNSGTAHEGVLVNISSYEQDIGTEYVNPSTIPGNTNSVKEHIAYLQNTTNEVLKNLKYQQNHFKGYFKNPNGEPYKQSGEEGYVDNTEFLNTYYEVNDDGEIINLNPNDLSNSDFTSQTYLVFANTNTIWCVNTSVTPKTWYNFGTQEDWQQIFNSLKNTDASILKPDQGTGLVGTSQFWSPADHAHPLNPDLFITKYGSSDKYLYFDVNSDVTEDSFKAVFNDFVNDKLVVSIPYVSESKYAHNWNGDFEGGIPTYNPGTSTNGKYMKLWAGTSDECVLEFGGNIPSDVLTFITDDSSNFEGEILNVKTFNDTLKEFKDSILKGTSVGNTYVFKPVSENGFGWEQVDLTSYISKSVPENLIGNWTFNSSPVTVINTDSFIDSAIGKSYNKLQYYNNTLLTINLGDDGGKYLVYNDVLNNIVTLVDTKYSVRTSFIGSGKISDAINNIWMQMVYYANTFADFETDLENVKDFVNLYPDFESTASSSYLLTKSDGSEKFTLSSFNPSSKMDANATVQEIRNETDNNSSYTSGGPINGSGLQQALQFVSKVLVHNGSNQSVVNNSYSFWTGTSSEFGSIPANSYVANRIYIVYKA